MKENKHSIQIGREYIGDVSAKELETLNRFIQDFLEKEKDIPKPPYPTNLTCFHKDRYSFTKTPFTTFSTAYLKQNIRCLSAMIRLQKSQEKNSLSCT